MTEEEILELISFNKKAEPEELFSIRKDCYLLVIKILLHFSFTNNLYKEPLLLLKDYINLIKQETQIYDFIIINLEQLNLDSISDLLSSIEELHLKAYNRLDRDLKDMEDALDIDDTNRIKRSKYIDISIKYNEYQTNFNSFKNSI